jgi:hypothetical protein
MLWFGPRHRTPVKKGLLEMTAEIHKRMWGSAGPPPDPLRPFRAADGMKFQTYRECMVTELARTMAAGVNRHKTRGIFRIRAGAYGSSGADGVARGAIQVDRDDGEPECTLTVNLAQVELNFGEFCVKMETIKHSPAPVAAMRFGLFVDTGRSVSLETASGGQHPPGAPAWETYAQIWRFAQCPHNDETLKFVVECDKCSEPFR